MKVAIILKFVRSELQFQFLKSSYSTRKQKPNRVGFYANSLYYIVLDSLEYKIKYS